MSYEVKACKKLFYKLNFSGRVTSFKIDYNYIPFTLLCLICYMLYTLYWYVYFYNPIFEYIYRI